MYIYILHLHYEESNRIIRYRSFRMINRRKFAKRGQLTKATGSIYTSSCIDVSHPAGQEAADSRPVRPNKVGIDAQEASRHGNGLSLEIYVTLCKNDFDHEKRESRMFSSPFISS